VLEQPEQAQGRQEVSGLSWRKSSRSGSNPYGNCVELAVVPADNELSEAEREMLAVAKAVGVVRR